MVGDVINLAARFMGKAKGRIVCDEVTHDLVRNTPNKNTNEYTVLLYRTLISNTVMPHYYTARLYRTITQRNYTARLYRAITKHDYLKH